MDFFVYMLRYGDDSFYVGHTDDLERRLAEHEHGVFPEGHTASRLPVTLVFSAAMPTREEAILREMQLKNWSRRKKEALIKEDWALVRWWALNPERRKALSSVGRSSTSSDRPEGDLSCGPSSTSSDRPDGEGPCSPPSRLRAPAAPPDAPSGSPA